MKRVIFAGCVLGMIAINGSGQTRSDGQDPHAKCRQQIYEAEKKARELSRTVKRLKAEHRKEIRSLESKLDSTKSELDGHFLELVSCRDELEKFKTNVARVSGDCSESATKNRETMIAKVRRLGGIHKVEYEYYSGTVWVTPEFYGLDVDTKKSFLNAVLAQSMCKKLSASVVILIDSRTNREVGIYSLRGLTIYDQQLASGK